MKNKFFILLVLSLLTTTCGGQEKPSLSPPTDKPPSPLPSPTLSPPTPTAELPGAEGTVSAFLGAWEAGDYGTMYAWTTPSTQAIIAPEDFDQRYVNAMAAAGVISITAELRSVLQEGTQAQASYHLVWHTALVGDLQADATMTLAFEGGHWGVAWHEGVIWPDLFGGYFMYMDYLTPVRANIYDRDGLGLAVESRLVSIGVIPGQINDETALLNTLSAVTGLPPARIQAKYAGQPADWYIAIGDVSVEAAQSYRGALETTAGLVLKEKDARYYPEEGVAPHIIGYVGLIPAERLEAYQAQGYRGDEWVGVAGLEAWGEPVLTGQPGVTLRVVTPDGRTHRTLAETELVVSRPIYTTLRREFQLKVQEILGDRTGAIVVLDAHSGALLALASGPGFDPNVFIVPSATTERTILLSDSRRPLLNRATQGTYPLGSVFKIITMAAALEEGGYSPESLYTCTGTWSELGPGAIKGDWLEGGHGTLTLVQGLERSCDPYFYHLGLDLANVDFDILPEFAQAFGLGQATGIEGVAEVSGLVPNPAWKLETHGEGWGVGDSVNLSIGQGFLTVTPLQVAQYVAAVANGGTLYRPRIVERIGAAPDGSVPEEVFEPEIVSKLPVSAENLSAIRQGMEGATQRAGGTATHRFYNLSVPVAGKTGTAQAPGETSLPHSWFAGYAPSNCDSLPEGCEEQVAIVVMIENAGEGSSVAAPMFRQVVEALFGLPQTPLPPEALPPTPTP
ncbi:MAG: penicillin-binding transpeptidase domain-containing protein [Anaerolineae bacterium]|jgi:penicillin-binding protein 2